MKRMAALVGAVVLFAATDAAAVVTMIAGPLAVNVSDAAICEIANVTAYARKVRIQVVRGNGLVVADTGPVWVTISAGHAMALTYAVPDDVGIPFYCKFIGALPAYFRASMAIYDAPTAGSDRVALPAQ
jgi:hypothetical protein